MLSFKHDSHSLKIEDFEINSINTFKPNSNFGEDYIVKPITRKVFKVVLDVKF